MESEWQKKNRQNRPKTHLGIAQPLHATPTTKPLYPNTLSTSSAPWKKAPIKKMGRNSSRFPSNAVGAWPKGRKQMEGFFWFFSMVFRCIYDRPTNTIALPIWFLKKWAKESRKNMVRKWQNWKKGSARHSPAYVAIQGLIRRVEIPIEVNHQQECLIHQKCTSLSQEQDSVAKNGGGWSLRRQRTTWRRWGWRLQKNGAKAYFVKACIFVSFVPMEVLQWRKEMRIRCRIQIWCFDWIISSLRDFAGCDTASLPKSGNEGAFVAIFLATKAICADWR